MRSFLKNNQGNIGMVLTAVVLAITLAISIVIVWNVMDSIDTDTADDNIQENIYGDSTRDDIKPAYNASLDIETNLETFYTVAPIVLIVVAAVGILSYVLMLRRT